MVFLARAYPRRYGHGKTWNRVLKHYKKNWTILERLLWIYVFKERYESKYVAFAYLSYVHIVLTLVAVCLAVVSLNIYPSSKIWIYALAIDGAFVITRIIYTDKIATSK